MAVNRAVSDGSKIIAIAEYILKYISRYPHTGERVIFDSKCEQVNTQNTNNNSTPPRIPTTDLLLTPAPKAVARPRVEKIRAELNIEKWPAIWQPAKSKNRPALRVMEREVTADDGNRIVSRVEVGYTQLGTLSTEEQKMLYVLTKLWEDSGKPD